MAVTPLKDWGPLLDTNQDEIATGTVTSLSAGTGITLTPDPTTTIGTVALTTPVAIADGGTGQATAANAYKALSPLTTLGDILYEDATPKPTRLAGNTTATRKFLRQTGTGAVSAPPLWDTLVSGDVPAGFLKADGTVPLTANWNAGNYLVRSQNSAGWKDVKAYGAKGDGIATVGDMAAGSDHLICGAASFGAGDVGKTVTVRGAGAGGATLITHINSLVGAPPTTEVVLHDVNASGGPIVGAYVIYGTNDATAVANAIIGAKAECIETDGGTVSFPPGRYVIDGTSIALNSNESGMTLQGYGNCTAGGAPTTQLVFTAAAGPLIDVTNSSGVTLRNFAVLAENSAFAGSIVGAAAASTSFLRVEGCMFDSGGAGATTAIDLDHPDSIIHSIDSCSFYNGAKYISGAANLVRITRNQFGQSGGAGCTDAAVKPAGQAWTITGNNFEPGKTNQAAGIVCTASCSGLEISGNWMGDITAIVAQTWITIRGSGISIHGNFIDGSSAQSCTGIKISAASTGVAIRANYINFGAQLGCVGIDGGGFANVALVPTPNHVIAATKTSGLQASNFYAQGTSANLRFGIGNMEPDSYSYAAGDAVFEVQARSGKGVWETTGSTDQSADGSIQGEFTAVALSDSGAADKRIAVMQAVNDGATATNRGGRLKFYTKADAGALAEAFRLDRSKNATFFGAPILTVAAATVGAGEASIGATHATTVGAAGGADALPATPLGYLICNVEGTTVKIPYYVAA